MKLARTVFRKAATAILWLAITLTVLLIAVAAILPAAFGWVPVSILSSSMSDGGIPAGSLIFVDPVENFVSEVRINDVVTLMPEQNNAATLITHRIVEIAYGPTGPMVATKGDSNASNDPGALPAEAVRAKLVTFSIGPFTAPAVIPMIGEPVIALSKFKAESGIQEHIPAIGAGVIGAGCLYLAVGFLPKRRKKNAGEVETEGLTATPSTNRLRGP